MQYATYISPFLALQGCSLLGLADQIPKKNSPSGLVAIISVEHDLPVQMIIEDEVVSEAQYDVLRVEIRGPDGDVLYNRPQPDLSARHSAYWSWDDEDRLWLYHSDRGDVRMWSRLEPAQFQKVAGVCEALDSRAPRGAFPAYALEGCP